MVTHGEKRWLPVGNFAAASREKPMAIDSSSDAARGEPPSHYESECGDGRDGRVRLALRRVAERCSHVARHEALRCHQCRSRPRPRASPRIRQSRVCRLGGLRTSREVIVWATGRAGPTAAAKRGRAQSGRADGHNPMPLLIDAARVHDSEGEILATLQQVWGDYRERPALCWQPARRRPPPLRGSGSWSPSPASMSHDRGAQDHRPRTTQQSSPMQPCRRCSSG
jgi:hypothetical protein